jgi:uncharacterized membrane protein YecN with MAPEG domain
MQSLTTGWYAALATAMYAGLSLHTVALRRHLRVSLGDAGHEALQRAVRIHANFAEYVPLALLLILMAELCDAPTWLLHAMGGTLLIARCLHAYGLSSQRIKAPFRPAGLTLTLTVMLTASGFLCIKNLSTI